MAVESVRDPVNGVPFKTSDTNSLTNGSSLAETFDTFLTLLTTQLQHQDPLDPMDTGEFTSQLVDFTGVEQAINTNKKLDSLIALQNELIGRQTGPQLDRAANYIGKTVSADSIVLMLQDGESTLTYDLAGNADEVSITIIDEHGETVRSIKIDDDTEMGHHEIVWDGLDDDGNAVEGGLYGFLVTAVDAENRPVELIQGTSGQVTGAKLVDGEVMLEIGELEVAMSDILVVRH